MLDPKLTASWEKGLSQVAEGTIKGEEYMDKLEGFVQRRTDYVKGHDNRNGMIPYFNRAKTFYKTGKTRAETKKESKTEL